MAAKSKEVKKVTSKKETAKKVAAKSTVKTVKSVKKPRDSGLDVPFYSTAGEANGTLTLSKDIFGQKPNKTLLAQAVRVFLSNQRSAGAKTKGRGEINRTKKKVYRQKGTGGARHGSRSAPIYVGGGIAHGPRGIENYELTLSKRMKKKALVSALSAKAKDGLVAVADIEKIEPKTGNFAKVLSKIGMTRPVVVHAGSSDLVRAGKNISSIALVPAVQLNAYMTLAAKSIIFTKDAVSQIESRFKEEK